MALKKKQRLRGKRKFAAVFSATRPLSSGGMTIRVHSGDFKSAAFAVIVPSGIVRQAAKRNKLRRRVTEVLRTLIAQYQPVNTSHVVITVRKPEFTNQEIRDSLVLLLKKSGILKQ